MLEKSSNRQDLLAEDPLETGDGKMFVPLAEEQNTITKHDVIQNEGTPMDNNVVADESNSANDIIEILDKEGETATCSTAVQQPFAETDLPEDYTDVIVITDNAVEESFEEQKSKSTKISNVSQSDEIEKDTAFDAIENIDAEVDAAETVPDQTVYEKSPVQKVKSKEVSIEQTKIVSTESADICVDISVTEICEETTILNEEHAEMKEIPQNMSAKKPDCECPDIFMDNSNIDESFADEAINEENNAIIAKELPKERSLSNPAAESAEAEAHESKVTVVVNAHTTLPNKSLIENEEKLKSLSEQTDKTAGETSANIFQAASEKYVTESEIVYKSQVVKNEIVEKQTQRKKSHQLMKMWNNYLSNLKIHRIDRIQETSGNVENKTDDNISDDELATTLREAEAFDILEEASQTSENTENTSRVDENIIEVAIQQISSSESLVKSASEENTFSEGSTDTATRIVKYDFEIEISERNRLEEQEVNLDESATTSGQIKCSQTIEIIHDKIPSTDEDPEILEEINQEEAIKDIVKDDEKVSESVPYLNQAMALLPKVMRDMVELVKKILEAEQVSKVPHCIEERNEHPTVSVTVIEEPVPKRNRRKINISEPSAETSRTRREEVPINNDDTNPKSSADSIEHSEKETFTKQTIKRGRQRKVEDTEVMNPEATATRRGGRQKKEATKITASPFHKGSNKIENVNLRVEHITGDSEVDEIYTSSISANAVLGEEATTPNKMTLPPTEVKNPVKRTHSSPDSIQVADEKPVKQQNSRVIDVEKSEEKEIIRACSLFIRTKTDNTNVSSLHEKKQDAEEDVAMKPQKSTDNKNREEVVSEENITEDNLKPEEQSDKQISSQEVKARRGRTKVTTDENQFAVSQHVEPITMKNSGSNRKRVGRTKQVAAAKEDVDNNDIQPNDGNKTDEPTNIEKKAEDKHDNLNVSSEIQYSQEETKRGRASVVGVSTSPSTPSITTARGRTRKPTAKVQQYLEEERAKADTPKKRALLAIATANEDVTTPQATPVRRGRKPSSTNEIKAERTPLASKVVGRPKVAILHVQEQESVFLYPQQQPQFQKKKKMLICSRLRRLRKA
ncbi:hypothetical protein EVAR_67968_1 [Eumeta japonica]|uniref:Uncharacterized protein n=1 Tax=Eumeta variegata TaxID=151549 RepID=A0A4C2A2W3_EUMVA|nr:hypothetical protein EVAR_67968_1 [Eumeta japonica]